MRAGLLLLVATACTVPITYIDPLGKECSASEVSEACPAPYVCSGGICALADAGGDGGPTNAPDSGADAGGGLDGGDAGASCLGSAWTVTPVATFSDAIITDVAVGDFNHDGLPDLVALDSVAGGLPELLNTGAGGLEAESSSVNAPVCESVAPTTLAAADFDGDGWTDVAVSFEEIDMAGLLINDHQGGFVGGPLDTLSSAISCQLLPSGDAGVVDAQPNSFRPISVAAVDGGFAVAVDDPSDGGVYLLAIPPDPDSDSTEPFTAIDTFGVQPSGIVTADVNGDGLPDFVAIIPGTNFELAVYIGHADGTFVSTQRLIAGRGTGDLVVADLDGDGFVDLIYVDSADNDVSVNFGGPSGFTAMSAQFSTLLGDAGASPVSLTVTDLDGDGKLDVATVNGSIDQSGAGSGSLTLLHGCSDGGLIAVGTVPTTLNGPRVIVALKLDNDAGPTSLAVAYSAAAQASFVDLFESSCP